MAAETSGTPSGVEKPNFYNLAYDFDLQTEFVSSPNGMRAAEVTLQDGTRVPSAYSQIVGMGEAVIPSILYHLQYPHDMNEDNDPGEPQFPKPSPYLVLALDEITKQDITGFAELRGDTTAMIERALAWGETESYIGIRSEEVRRLKADALYELFKDSLLRHVYPDQVLDVMAQAEERSQHSRYGNEPWKVELANGRSVYVSLSSDHDGKDISLRTGKYDRPILGIGTGRYPRFWINGEQNDSLKSEEKIKQIVVEMFDPEPTQEQAPTT